MPLQIRLRQHSNTNKLNSTQGLSGGSFCLNPNFIFLIVCIQLITMCLLYVSHLSQFVSEMEHFLYICTTHKIN